MIKMMYGRTIFTVLVVILVISRYSEIGALPLFEKYPPLQGHLPHISLAALPTPLYTSESLSALLGVTLLIKNDGLSGKRCMKEGGYDLFGGNKVRKLEFLLADALCQGADTVITFGCVGSNHAVATATYCDQLGLKCDLMLVAEPNSSTVRRNLILDHVHGARMYFCATAREKNERVAAVQDEAKVDGKRAPYVIPTGGSCALGVVGYVNAMMELKQQLDENKLPYPRRIYVALGSAGTLTGLVLGAKLADIPCVIVGINTNLGAYFGKQVPVLFEQTNALLHNVDGSIPLFTLEAGDYEIIEGQCGKGYGHFTPQGQKALALVHKTENILLDGVYTAKAFAGMMADINAKKLEGTTVLFWNTFCSTPYAAVLESHSFTQLPEPFHRYFIEPVQELDSVL